MFGQAGREISRSLNLQRPPALRGGGGDAGGLGAKAWAYTLPRPPVIDLLPQFQLSPDTDPAPYYLLSLCASGLDGQGTWEALPFHLLHRDALGRPSNR